MLERLHTTSLRLWIEGEVKEQTRLSIFVAGTKGGSRINIISKTNRVFGDDGMNRPDSAY